MITKKLHKRKKFVMEVIGMEIKRDYYLKELVDRLDNGLIKIILTIKR